MPHVGKSHLTPSIYLAILLAFGVGCAEDEVGRRLDAEIECDEGFVLSAGKCVPMPGTINGRICDRYTGQWLEGVSVSLGQESSASATTDDAGHYTLSDVPAGVQEVYVDGEAYDNRYVANVGPGGEIVLGPDECVSVLGSFFGFACDDTGIPLEGVAVTIDDAAQTSVMSDSTGFFDFKNIIAGAYNLTIYGANTTTSRSIDIPAGADTDVGPSACGEPLPPSGPLGELTGYACAPEVGVLGGAQVWIELEDDQIVESTTGVDGYFQLANVPVGDQVLWVKLNNQFMIARAVTAVEGASAEVDFGACAVGVSFNHEMEVCGVLDQTFDPPPLDLLFLVDTTGSMGSPIQNLQTNMLEIYQSISQTVDDALFAVANYEDFPEYAASTDRPFTLVQPLTSDTTLMQAGIESLTDAYGYPTGGGGGDIASAYEAIYQAATGEGLDVNGNGSYTDATGGDIAPSSVGWRDGSARIVVLVTDAPGRNPDTGDAAPTGAHGSSEVLQALADHNVLVVGISAADGAFPDMELLANGTSATIEDGFDVDGDGLYTSNGDIAPAGPLVFKTDTTGQLMGTVGSDVAYALSTAVDALLPTKVVAELGGADATGLEITSDPPFYDDVNIGEQACFNITISGSLPLGEEGESRDIRVEIVWEDGTLVESEGVTVTVTPDDQDS
jgi:hypothetical protein